MEKALKDITRTEWIKYQWHDVTQMGDDERMMQQGFIRTPDESHQAMEEWEVTAEDRGVSEPESESESEDEKGVLQ